jgi:indolepyruvate ferredoxin oxidoreductase
VRLLELRVPELVAYQNRRYARRYLAFVREVREAEADRTPGETSATEAVACNLFKLMAYKDEYEVARLHLDTVERAKLSAEFGKGARVWFNIHPPLLRALGLDRKLKLGRWFVPAFRLLRGMRRLRGTPLDVFGLTEVRRTERRLVGEYRGLVRAAIDRLEIETHERVVELCELPDVIRGYEEIKLRSVERFRKRSEALLEQVHGTPADAPTTG